MKQASTACHSRVSRGMQNTDSRRFQPVPWRINDFPYQGAGKAIIPVYWLGRCCSGPRSREGLLTDNSAFECADLLDHGVGAVNQHVMATELHPLRIGAWLRQAFGFPVLDGAFFTGVLIRCFVAAGVSGVVIHGLGQYRVVLAITGVVVCGLRCIGHCAQNAGNE